VVSEKKLDKDRFRKDLGNLIQAYQEVAERLGITIKKRTLET
jgi:phosphoribosylaminoimidazole-succinocarboxamide synthase